MDSLVERLRAITWPDRTDSDIAETCREAADEIERLCAEVLRLESARDAYADELRDRT